MNAALVLLLALVLALAGFAALALAMPRHWHDVTGIDCETVPARAPLRWSGAALISASVALCWWVDGPSFGSLLALLCTSAAAALVAQVLAWRPQWLRPLLRTGRAGPPQTRNP